MDKITTNVYCKDCENFKGFGYEEIDGARVEVTTCEMASYREHAQAEKNNWITECDYYE